MFWGQMKKTPLYLNGGDVGYFDFGQRRFLFIVLAINIYLKLHENYKNV
jgi:hypothetical protein